MGGANQGRGIAKIAEQLAARLSRLLRTVVDPHAEIGVAGLQRRVDHVAGDYSLRTLFADLHRVMIDGVTWRGKQLHDIAELVLALHNLLAICRNDWKNGVGDPRRRRWISFLCFGPVGELAVGEDVLGLREGRNPASIL